MGFFGSDSSKTYSTTNLTQEDKSVQAAGDAENVLGSGAKLTAGGSGSLIIDAPNTTMGEIVFNQYPEAVQQTIASLIKSVDTTTKTIGESLSQQQLGGEAILPKIILYLVVGGGLFFILGKRFLK
jgi:hypothetical protein